MYVQLQYDCKPSISFERISIESGLIVNVKVTHFETVADSMLLLSNKFHSGVFSENFA